MAAGLHHRDPVVKSTGIFLFVLLAGRSAGCKQYLFLFIIGIMPRFKLLPPKSLFTTLSFAFTLSSHNLSHFLCVLATLSPRRRDFRGAISGAPGQCRTVPVLQVAGFSLRPFGPLSPPPSHRRWCTSLFTHLQFF